MSLRKKKEEKKNREREREREKEGYFQPSDLLYANFNVMTRT